MFSDRTDESLQVDTCPIPVELQGDGFPFHTSDFVTCIGALGGDQVFEQFRVPVSAMFGSMKRRMWSGASMQE
eukprot:5775296-Amphidinium_carterae.1